MKQKISLFLVAICLFFSVKSFSQTNTDEFKPSGKISFQTFGDYMYVAQADKNITTYSNAILNKDKEFNAFKLRRAFLGYDYNFTSKISTMVRLEVTESNQASKGMIAILKDAWVKFKLGENNELIAGIQGTVAVEEAEKNWGHRYLEQNVIDIRKGIGSRDFGVTLKGKIASKLNYAVALYNNSELLPETDKYKRAAAYLGIKPVETLSIGLYGDYTWKAKNSGGKTNNDILVGFFFGVKTQKLGVGLEAFMKQYKNNVQTDVPTNRWRDQKNEGISVYAYYKITDKVELLGRFDSNDQDNDSGKKDDKRNYGIVSVNYTIAPGVTVSPNVQMESYEKIGDYKPEASIVPRITLFWVLK